jgi:hypothetical protein
MSVKRPGWVPFLTCKCPKCATGRVFNNRLISVKFAQTRYSCPSCSFSFEPEPGFFYGAMYFSYALMVGLIVTCCIIFYGIGKFDYAIVGIPIAIVIMVPLIFRYSRMMMLYIVYPLMYKDKFYGKP